MADAGARQQETIEGGKLEVAVVTGTGGMNRVALVYVRRSIVRYAEDLSLIHI